MTAEPTGQVQDGSSKGLFYYQIAAGLFTLQPWAWVLGVALQIISLVLAGFSIIGGQDIASQIIGIAIAAIILYYLFQPSIRSLFKAT